MDALAGNAETHCARLIVVEAATHATGWDKLGADLYAVNPRCGVAQP